VPMTKSRESGALRNMLAARELIFKTAHGIRIRSAESKSSGPPWVNDANPSSKSKLSTRNGFQTDGFQPIVGALPFSTCQLFLFMHTVPLRKLLAVVIAILTLHPRAFALEPVREFNYTARISAQDHLRNSDNANLSQIPGIKPQDILLQERLNFHKYGKRDREDTDDKVYSQVNESHFYAIYGDSRLRTIPARSENVIVNGAPLVNVSYNSYSGFTVSLLDSAGSSIQAHSGGVRQRPSERDSVSTGTSFFQSLLPSHLGFNAFKLFLGLVGAAVSCLAGIYIRKTLCEKTSTLAERHESRLFRGAVFFIVALLVMYRANFIIAFLEVEHPPWWLPLVVASTSAGIIALFPETAIFTLIVWPVLLLVVPASIAYALTWVLFGILWIAILCAPVGIYGSSLYFPVVRLFHAYGYNLTSVYVLAWLTIFFMSFRSVLNATKSTLESTRKSSIVVTKWVLRFFPTYFLATVMCNCAMKAGLWLGGDYSKKDER